MSSPKYLWSIGFTIGVFYSLGAGYVSPVQAGTLYQEWDYTIDSFNDGLDGGTLGANSEIELYGMAVKEVDNSLYFAFNSNLSLNGQLSRRAYNRRVSYGDLFLNFSSTSSTSTFNTYGIRFDVLNDSRLTPGLYQEVSGVSLSQANTGFGTLDQAHEAIASQGGTVSYGRLGLDSPYLDQQSTAITTISTGAYLGDVDLITDMADLDLGFSRFGATGTHTFGLRVDRNLLPSGEFIASLFVESGNDGIVLQGVLNEHFEPPNPANREVPEPTSLIGIGLLSLIEIGRRGWQGKSNKRSPDQKRPCSFSNVPPQGPT
ncbi:MAG: XDD3 family exosortase-dependent surface protein [Cyanobacteria bacterium P01_F01_bin.150]